MSRNATKCVHLCQSRQCKKKLKAAESVFFKAFSSALLSTALREAVLNGDILTATTKSDVYGLSNTRKTRRVTLNSSRLWKVGRHNVQLHIYTQKRLLLTDTSNENANRARFYSKKTHKVASTTRDQPQTEGKNCTYITKWNVLTSVVQKNRTFEQLHINIQWRIPVNKSRGPGQIMAHLFP